MNIITRIAAGTLGVASLLTGALSFVHGPSVEPHLPLHTTPYYVPPGVLTGLVLLAIALAPRRWW